MNRLAIIISLFVSLINCSFVIGIFTLLYAPTLYVYPLTLAYEFTEFIQTLYEIYLKQLFFTCYTPSVAITYYMIAD